MKLSGDGVPSRTVVNGLAIVWAIGIGFAFAAAPTAGAPVPPPIVTAEPAGRTIVPATPVAGQATGFVGDDTCTTCHEPEGKGLHATLHGKAQNVRTPAAKTGPGLRNLPRSRPGARRVRRQDQDQAVHGDVAEGRQRDLPDLPQQGLARAVERRHARRAQPVVRQLPQRAQPEVGAGRS